MNRSVTDPTVCRRGDLGGSDWVEGSHSPYRRPQYNSSNIASAQEADKVTAVGEQDLPDMALFVEYTGDYPQTIHLENEEPDDTFVIVGCVPGLESLEAAMADVQADTGVTLLPLTEAHLVQQAGSLQREPVCRWVLAAPGFSAQPQAEYQPVLSSSSIYTETLVSYDNSGWEGLSNESVNTGRDTECVGSVFSTWSATASSGDELDVD